MIEDAEDLTSEQRTELGAALHALEVELEAALELAREGSKPVALDQAAVGRVSRGDALQQQQMALATVRATEVRLAQVKRALTAFASGEYGGCVGCEENIGYRRLRSRPETPLCLRCQTEREAE
jgi:DnaK suppressor protein